MKEFKSKLLTLLAFSIAMGLLESAVVIYLREIYYPEGFKFPMVLISGRIALTELLRELATLVMLLTIAILIGKTFTQRFAWFIFSFAVWDIFYYVFLYVLIGWPESLFTWDILFLIPTVWVGHVIEPVFLSVVMIVFSVIIHLYSIKNLQTKISSREWAALITGSVMIIISFTLDYAKYYFEKFSTKELFSAEFYPHIQNYMNTYIPREIATEWFSAGTGLIFIAIVDFIIRNKKLIKQMKLAA